MLRRLIFPILAALLVTLVDVRPAKAWVIMSVLRKGEVPEQRFPKSVTQPLKKILPMRGVAIDGFPNYSCTLYYRGTHDNVQELLTELGKAKEVSLFVQFDRSGKVGKLESRKAFPMKRPLTYLYHVFLSRNDHIDLGFEQTKAQLSVTVKIFAAGGIDPDKLKLPPHVNRRKVTATLRRNIRATTGLADTRAVNRDNFLKVAANH